MWQRFSLTRAPSIVDEQAKCCIVPHFPASPCPRCFTWVPMSVLYNMDLQYSSTFPSAEKGKTWPQLLTVLSSDTHMEF